MKAKTSRTVLVLMIFLATPFWIICLFLASETAWRIYGGMRFVIAHSHIIKEIDEYRRADDVIFQEISKKFPPPDTVAWNVPPRETFIGLDEPARAKLAETRHELILICDERGQITAVYPCTGIPQMKMLSETISVGDTLRVFLPEQEFDDAVRAIRETGEDERPLRDYNIPLPDGTTYFTEFYAFRISDAPLYAVFLGGSRYETLGRAYRPDFYLENWYVGQFLNSTFWTNSRGMRDRETTVPKPSGVVRIVCVGGSTTVEGPHNELTYPKFLEKLLRERLNTDAIEVINGGVDALGFPTEMERMPDWLALDPDLIIHYNIVNNMPGILDNAIRKSGMRDGWRGRVRELAAKSKLLTCLFPNWFRPPEAYVAEEIKVLANVCFAKMAEQAQAKGAALAVASFAVPDVNSISSCERIYFDYSFHTFPLARATTADYNWAMGLYNQTVREYCQESGVLYIPVAENFSGGVDTFTDICHMRLRGIELKARIMADHLEAFVRGRLERYREESSMQVVSPM